LESFSDQNFSIEETKSQSVLSQILERQTIEQTMEVLPNGTRRLAAQLRTQNPFQELWQILTNYDQLSEFIPNLSKSEVIFRDGNEIHLKQVGSQDFFGFKFSAEVLLRLVEDKSNGILRFDLLKGDFRRFEGSWNLRELPNEKYTLLLYELTVQGCIGMPVSLIEQRLRKDLKDNLLAVKEAASKLKGIN
tara:strand:- start:79 stop:651 length:573 start_codon:yes stop_codon:yes gene_type:complete